MVSILAGLGLDSFASVFFEHGVDDPAVMHLLTDDHLKSMGMNLGLCGSKAFSDLLGLRG